MILMKGIIGGVVAALLMWCVILSAHMWRLSAAVRRQGVTGLWAVAGGWTYLLHVPLVVILLMAAFGIGFYLLVR